MAPKTGIEPVTNSLTASCSTAELLRNREHCIGDLSNFKEATHAVVLCASAHVLYTGAMQEKPRAAKEASDQFPDCVVLVSQRFPHLNEFWKNDDWFTPEERKIVLDALDTVQFKIYPVEWETYKKYKEEDRANTALGKVRNLYQADKYIIQLIEHVLYASQEIELTTLRSIVGQLYTSREIIQ